MGQGSTKEFTMKTYRLALEMVQEVAGLNQRIGRRDADLARQLRRASMSVPLNINEGMYSRGQNRSARLCNAMASAKESVACLEVAVAVDYLDRKSIAGALEQLDHLVAALWNMVHKPWR
jgi:four helix bundle protein